MIRQPIRSKEWDKAWLSMYFGGYDRPREEEFNPFLCDEHTRGFEEYNCNQCILSSHYHLFVKYRKLIECGKVIDVFEHWTPCKTEDAIISEVAGYYHHLPASFLGFSMSRFPVSDCAMKEPEDDQ